MHKGQLPQSRRLRETRRASSLREGAYKEETPQSAAFRETASDSVPLAVPEKRCGLTLSLAFFDRCGKSALASSATGGASPLSPLQGSL
jgi:hypothetical protein